MRRLDISESLPFEEVVGLAALAHPDVLWGVGQEREMTGALDRARQRPLVLRAGARFSPRLDTCSIGDKASQEADVLVVHGLDLVGAHDADAAPASASPSARPVVALCAWGWPAPRARATVAHRAAWPVTWC